MQRDFEIKIEVKAILVEANEVEESFWTDTDVAVFREYTEERLKFISAQHKIHSLQREIGRLKKTRNKHKLNCNFLRKVRKWCKKKISNRICCWNDVHKGYGLEFLVDTV